MIQKIDISSDKDILQSIPQLIDMLDIRVALETRALKLAIPNMEQSDFDKARNVLALYQVSELPHGWSLMNFQFHMGLYQPCQRPKLLELIEETSNSFSRLSKARVSFVTGREVPQSEHYEILKACEARNIKRAVSLLEHHIERTQQVLMELYQQQSG